MVQGAQEDYSAAFYLLWWVNKVKAGVMPGKVVIGMIDYNAVCVVNMGSCDECCFVGIVHSNDWLQGNI